MRILKPDEVNLIIRHFKEEPEIPPEYKALFEVDWLADDDMTTTCAEQSEPMSSEALEFAKAILSQKEPPAKINWRAMWGQNVIRQETDYTFWAQSTAVS